MVFLSCIRDGRGENDSSKTIKIEADVNNDAGLEVGSGADRIKPYEEMTPTKLQRNIRLYIYNMTTAKFEFNL